MAKVYDIDAILDQRPKVRLRGELYPVADLPVVERVRATAERMKQRARIAEMEDAGEDTSAALAELQVSAVGMMLDGVPEDEAATLTEAEFEAVVLAVAEVRGMDLKIEPTEEGEGNE